MTPPWLVVIVIAEILARLLMPPKSLAAAAEREAMRRQMTGPSVGLYSNDNLNSERRLEVVPPVATRSDSQPGATVADTRDEKWWRQRVAAVRSAIGGDEQRVAALESEIARLDTQAIARDDPAEQAVLRQQAIEARDELKRVRAGIGATRQELADLLEEARRLDVPPGWLR
jgi:septal ring factor EnvC (AmiA/AmiB activator)